MLANLIARLIWIAIEELFGLGRKSTKGRSVTSKIPNTRIVVRQPIRQQSPMGQGSVSGRAPLAPAIPNDSLQAVASNRGKIRSASISELTSPGLSKFHELLTHAQQERSRLLPELQAAVEEAHRLEQKQTFWQQGRFLRQVFPGRYVRIQESATQTTARRNELQEQVRLSRLQTHIDLPAQVREAYGQLLDAFAIVKKCERKWDTVSRVAADQVRERTIASYKIDRKPVDFDLRSCDLIESEWMVPYLANADGADLYIYPGFVLLYRSADAFALVDVSEVEIKASIEEFIESETVPADTRIIKQTWKKINKDGSRDRRFTNNYQIPVVEYGSLTITSQSGLNEEYMLSRFGAAAQFASVWKAFKEVAAQTTAYRAAMLSFNP